MHKQLKKGNSSIPNLKITLIMKKLMKQIVFVCCIAFWCCKNSILQSRAEVRCNVNRCWVNLSNSCGVAIILFHYPDSHPFVRQSNKFLHPRKSLSVGINQFIKKLKYISNVSLHSFLQSNTIIICMLKVCLV